MTPPPPESQEKRQRNRRKQLKRKEKLERRLQRKDDKRRADNPLYHTLHRGDELYQVETDLWLAVLDLAMVSGWAPPESDPESEDQPKAVAYATPAGLELSGDETKALATSILKLLPMISEEELPLSQLPFGYENTKKLLARRAAGEQLPNEEATAAHEMLSGPPKKEVERLAMFLQDGPVSIEAS